MTEAERRSAIRNILYRESPVEIDANVLRTIADQIIAALPVSPGPDKAMAVPSVANIIMFLREGCGDYVIQMPGGQRAKPAEIWIPGLGCWVRANGSFVSADYARGFRYFGRFTAWRIRRAVKVFDRLVQRYPSDEIEDGVTQADRDAAADAMKASFITPDVVASNVRAGGADNGPWVQAFRAHRVAALSSKEGADGLTSRQA